MIGALRNKNCGMDLCKNEMLELYMEYNSCICEMGQYKKRNEQVMIMNTLENFISFR